LPGDFRWQVAAAAYNAYEFAYSEITRSLGAQQPSSDMAALKARAAKDASKALDMAVFITNDEAAPKAQRCQFAMLGGSTSGRPPGIDSCH
jgi:hypothetical protein